MHLQEGLLARGQARCAAGLAGAVAVLKHEAAAEGRQVRVVGGRAVGHRPVGGGGEGGMLLWLAVGGVCMHVISAQRSA